ncbi:diguanylate cyclase domain-containing protein [Breznakiella homolactica]|uniref:Diguanylate cyclase n=1 Tax=Breznakiella homolactica TaxID=2798577 RepID=A0A7T7XQZ7_9SPIR|nr:diguanylate cyclase [Breznakiella homolactica]QQO10783.1 diguanylate cyclase [Breznakiella homolactica]
MQVLLKKNFVNSKSIISKIDEYNIQSWEYAPSEPAKSLEIARKALELSDNIHYTKGTAYANLNYGWSNYFLSSLDDAEQGIHEALNYFSPHNNNDAQASAFMILGVIEKERGRFNKALDNSKKSIELARLSGLKDREAAALNTIGELMCGSGNTLEGLEYYQQAIKLIESPDKQRAVSISTPEIESVTYSNIGEAYILRGELNTALGYLELAQHLARESGTFGIEIKVLKQMAEINRLQGLYTEAKSLLRQADEMARRCGQILYQMDIQMALARVHTSQGQNRRAMELLNRTVRNCEKCGLYSKLQECYSHRSRIHESLGIFNKALEDLKKSNCLNDASCADRIAQSIHDVYKTFEVEQARKEAEIFHLRNVELRSEHEKLEQATRRMGAVIEIGKVIAVSMDIESAAMIAHKRLLELIDAHEFVLAIAHEEDGTIEFISILKNGKFKQTSTISMDDTNSFAAWVIRNNKTLRLDDIPRQYKKYVEEPLLFSIKRALSIALVPLQADSRTIGAMGLLSKVPGAYSDDDIRFIRVLGVFLAVAIHNNRTRSELIRLNTELRNEKQSLEELNGTMKILANHDGLTGLANRTLLDELSESVIENAKRYSRQFAVLYMDLDNFKPINDSLGHDSGDAVLVEVARRLKKSIRSSDIIARVGGDEFIAVLQNVDTPETAQNIAEKLINGMQRPIRVGKDTVRLGISIGIALYPLHGEDFNSLCRNADNAMYQVKQDRKNWYAFADKNKKSR